MFAGPNGSGKSTIKSVVSPALLGVYINPDEIEEEIRRSGSLSLEAYRVAATEEEISAFVAGSPLAQKAFRDLAAGVMASEDTSPRIKNLPPLTQSCNLTICPP